MKHVYLGILFVMNCFWADLWESKEGDGGVGGDSQQEKVNDKCHYNKWAYSFSCVYPIFTP